MNPAARMVALLDAQARAWQDQPPDHPVLVAGTTATDEQNAIHWDGSRTGDPTPAIIYLYGEGPVSTVFVDTSGKPLPKK